MENLAEEIPGTIGRRVVEELAGSVASTMAPSAMKITRFAASRANPISWVTTSMVMPSRASRHHVEHLVDHLGVKGAGRLVEQHHLGFIASAARSRRAAAGHRTAGPGTCRPGWRSRPARGAPSPLPGVGLRHLADLDRGERDVLEDRLVGEQVERLEDHPDVGPQLRELASLSGTPHRRSRSRPRRWARAG